jgi:hypothetical protein
MGIHARARTIWRATGRAAEAEAPTAALAGPSHIAMWPTFRRKKSMRIAHRRTERLSNLRRIAPLAELMLIGHNLRKSKAARVIA